MTRRWRVVSWGLGIAGVIGLLTVVFRFPWRETAATVVGVSVPLVIAAVLVNLLSPFAKGWEWHLLLNGVAPNRWWVAQQANLIGTAVNSVTAGVSGEAARITVIVQRDRVPARSALIAVVWSRAVEALGLAFFLLLAPLALPLPRVLRGLQVAAGVALFTVLAATRLRPSAGWLARLPQAVADTLREVGEMGWSGRIAGPTAFALLSWSAEWATYHLSLRAAHIPVTPAASFTALIAVNLGGILRITPANVGVMQAAMVGALLPFGVAPERAVAGGLVLQAIEVLPILVLTMAVAGLPALKQLLAAKEPTELA